MYICQKREPGMELSQIYKRVKGNNKKKMKKQKIKLIKMFSNPKNKIKKKIPFSISISMI